jgi:hypothetical protein
MAQLADAPPRQAVVMTGNQQGDGGEFLTHTKGTQEAAGHFSPEDGEEVSGKDGALKP